MPPSIPVPDVTPGINGQKQFRPEILAFLKKLQEKRAKGARGPATILQTGESLLNGQPDENPQLGFLDVVQKAVQARQNTREYEEELMRDYVARGLLPKYPQAGRRGKWSEQNRSRGYAIPTYRAHLVIEDELKTSTEIERSPQKTLPSRSHQGSPGTQHSPSHWQQRMPCRRDGATRDKEKHTMSIRDLPDIEHESSEDSAVDQADKKPYLSKGHLLHFKIDTVVISASRDVNIKRDEIGMHIVAFLNSGKGGKIVIGAEPTTNQILGIPMDRKRRDLFRQGFDDFLDGRTIQPMVLTEMLNLEFHGVTDECKPKDELHLIVITIKSIPNVAIDKYKTMSTASRRMSAFVRYGQATQAVTANLIQKMTIKENL